MEGTLRSVDPFSYLVNILSDFDEEVIAAYKNKDKRKINQLASRGNRMDMNFFICVNKRWHGFILCVPAIDTSWDDEGSPFDVVKSLALFDIPAQKMCWQYELCIEDEEHRWYKIRKECCYFGDVEKRIERSFHVGKFKGMTSNALQFVALQAAPHRYSVLLEDCVEFAKAFCIQALEYSSNWRDIRESVRCKIDKVTASGFSAEKLSRNIRSSGWLGNTFLGGVDVSSWLSNRYGVAMAVCLGLFLLVYPVVVTVIVIKMYK